MCDNSDAIYNDSLSISHVSHHLNDIVYLQVEYTMDTAVAVTRYIYNCIDGHDVPYTYQGPIPVSCFTSMDILTSIDLIPMSLLAPRMVDNIPIHKILRVLFDSGGSLSLIHERVMPQGISLSNETSQLIHTIAGTYSSHASGMLMT